MSEYIVDVGNADTEHIALLGEQATHCFGHPIKERIVRCKDCKRFSLDNSDRDYRSGWWCHRWNTDMVRPDGFCAWGKRRDGE